MITAYKNVFISLWVPIFLILIGSSIQYYQNKGKHLDKTISITNDYLNKEYQYATDFIKDENRIKKEFSSELVQVYLFENEILDYWSDTQKLPLDVESLAVVDTFQNGILVLPVFSPLDSNLIVSIVDQLGLSHTLKFETSANDVQNKLKIGTRDFSVAVNPLTNINISTSLSMVILLLSFLWLLIVLFNKVNSIGSLLMAIVTGLVFRGLIFLLTLEPSAEQVFSNANVISNLNGSVGDYILNVILLFFILLSFQRGHKNVNHSISLQKLLALINGFFISFCFIYFCFISKGFILHPDINVDIDAVLLFDISSIILVITFILSNIFICLYSIYSLQSFKLKAESYQPLTYHLIGVMGSGFLFFFFLSFHPLVLAAFILAYLVMVDLFIDSRNKNVVWLIWWIVIHSLFITSLVYYYGIQKDQNAKKEFLERAFLIPEDQDLFNFQKLSEAYSLSDIPNTISNLPYPARLEIEDFQYFIEEHLKDTIPNGWQIENLFLIDNNNNSLIRDNTTDYYSYNQKFITSEKQYNNLYYDFLNSNYFLTDTIAAIDNQAGPFKFGVNLTRIASPLNHPKDNLLLFNNEEIAYPSLPTFDGSLLDRITQSDVDFSDKGFSFSVLRLTEDVKIVSFYPLAGLIKPMSLFSYLFTLAGIIVVLLSLLNTRFPFLPIPVSLKVNHKTSLRNKIQSGVITMLVFSFIIIGLLTAFYFNNVLQGNTLLRENNQLELMIEKIKAEAYFADNTESAINRILLKMDQLQEYFPYSLRLYDSYGNLISNGSIAKEEKEYRIPYNAWSQMSIDSKIISFSDPDLGSLSKTYVPLYYNDQPPFAFLSLTNNVEENSLSSIYDFLSTLLNVYVFLFLLAGAVGIIISNSITMPLSTLANKLREFKLGQSHDPLEWDSNDEIGTLIKDYNNLIVQVQESADIIAKTERDTAWREMAKQVAHEIKNPLTPMKLSLQYLQRAIKTEGVDPIPLIERVSTTLIEQINNLTNIANEFSNFAKMPKSNNNKVILNELVEAVHDLFRKREDMDILLSEPINELYVFADRNQLVRILNNLVKNAIQAIPTDRRGRIEISLLQKEQNAVVKVADNGIGIPDEMRKKVFTPNFTTKSSGTGLGLAISANIIEGFNGKIYFETELDKGTNFYVEIPLMRLGREVMDDKRVPLD